MRGLFDRQDYTAAGGISGTSVSTFFGTIVLLVIFSRPKHRREYRGLYESGGKVRKTREILRDSGK
jgi:hypothetical protein